MSKSTRILMVDDDPAVLKVYSIFLTLEGYEVWEATSGEQGLEMVRQQHPALVLLDVMLGDRSGLDVCRRIKQDPALQDTFVVLFSGEAIQPKDTVGGLEAGADDYLIKTTARSEFLARIRTMLRLQHSAASLRARENEFRELVETKNAIMDAALDAIITFDHQGRIVDFNAAAERTFGATRARVVGQELAALIGLPPQQVLGEQSLAARWARRADGTEFPVEMTVRRVAVAGPPMFAALVRDITERMRTEAQLAVLAHAVESTSEPICITDLQDRFTFVNRAFEQTYGYTKAEILGQHPEILFSPRNDAALKAEILKSSHVGRWRGEVLDCRKDGTELPVFLSTSQIQNQAGEVIGLMGVAQDITERKRAERQTATLSQLGYQLSAASEPGRAAEVIVQAASAILTWDAASILQYSQPEHRLTPLLVVQREEEECRRIPATTDGFAPGPLMRSVLLEGARLLSEPDPAQRVEALFPGVGMTACPASALCVPIRWSGLVLGLLSVQSHAPHAYSPEDLALLQTIADSCANTLRRIQMAETLREAEIKYPQHV